ncbi:MAG: hypothetical protein FDZ72_04660 [Betaproteobacteria bacterium]|nr:MAG: hypothetical protein FDZ72_04660 [Betaproteobacteria bacterium]
MGSYKPGAIYTRHSPFAKAAAFATITFIILTLAIGSLHLSLYERLPQEGAPALLTELGLLALSLTPAIIAGYSAGYLARANGIATGALAAAIAAVILWWQPRRGQLVPAFHIHRSGRPLWRLRRTARPEAY